MSKFSSKFFRNLFRGFRTRDTRVLRAPHAIHTRVASTPRGIFLVIISMRIFFQIFFPNFFFQIFLSKFSSKFSSEFFFKFFFQIFCQNSYNHEKNPAWGARNTRVSRMRNPRNKCRKNFEKNFDKKIWKRNLEKILKKNFEENFAKKIWKKNLKKNSEKKFCS